MARGLAVDFTLIGMPELRAKFLALPLVLQRKVVRQASRDIVKNWRDAAAAAARRLTSPANDTRLMLEVARGLKVRAIKRSRRFVGTRLVTPERGLLGRTLKGRIRSRYSQWYPPAHVHLGRRAKGSRRGVAAKPYLRSPMLRYGAVWNALFAGLIRDGMEREAAAKKIVVPQELD